MLLPAPALGTGLLKVSAGTQSTELSSKAPFLRGQAELQPRQGLCAGAALGFLAQGTHSGHSWGSLAGKGRFHSRVKVPSFLLESRDLGMCLGHRGLRRAAAKS